MNYPGFQDDVHFWIRQSWAIIHPSYHEGMSNVMMEAAASGRPVIATDVPGCREIFEDGVSGVSCKPLWTKLIRLWEMQKHERV